MIFSPERECMSRAEMTALQSERLRELVQRVYDTVAPYRAKMIAAGIRPADIRGVEDLYKLPFTVKQDLRDNYPFGMFSARREDIIRLHASSGTTGKLTVVGYTRHDIDLWSECMARSLAMAGATKNSIVHVAYGYGLFTGGLGAHYGAERLGAAVVPASSGNTKRQLDLLRDFGADVLCCTPSYALYLGSEIERLGLDKRAFALKAGVFGAEPWTNEMRREIEKKLNIRAYDVYGLSEISGPGVSMECAEQCGSHIQEDYYLPEIIDPETLEPLPEGEEGELVITTLTKEGIPLVRYRTRDLTRLDRSPCACGRTTVRMGRVKGRTDDMLIIRGVNVFPSQIETAIMHVSGIEPHYMIVVDRVGNLDTIEILIEMTTGLYGDTVSAIERVRKAIEGELHSMIGISAEVRLVEPNSLPRSEGKAKRVIDKRVI